MNNDLNGLMRILIVDDDVDSAESLADILELDGHQTNISFDGSQAVDKYLSEPFDLVFMDLKMPVLSGKEAIRRIFAFNSDANIVVVTGNTIQEEIEEVMEMGIFELLRKPYSINKIQEITHHFAH